MILPGLFRRLLGNKQSLFLVIRNPGAWNILYKMSSHFIINNMENNYNHIMPAGSFLLGR